MLLEVQAVPHSGSLQKPVRTKAFFCPKAGNSSLGEFSELNILSVDLDNTLSASHFRRS